MSSATEVRFTVTKVMNVVGIGHIITGRTIDNEVRPGATITLNGDTTMFVIDAVEKIEYAEANTVETALILEAVQDNAAESLFAVLPGQVLIIRSE